MASPPRVRLTDLDRCLPGPDHPADHEEVILERHWLEPDEEPPGRWEPDAATGLSIWRGRMSWSTRHGGAVVDWSLGRPQVIHGASTPEGPMRVETVSPADPTTWRRRSASLPGGWLHGRVVIADDGVAFTDLPRKFHAGRQGDGTGTPDLVEALAGDGAFLARLQDATFARAVYATLYNGSFRYGDHHRRWSASGRSAAAAIAGMRELGESYIDYFGDDWTLAAMPGDLRIPAGRQALFAEVAAHLGRLGWRRLDADGLADDHGTAMRDLAEAEGRPPGHTPDWASGMATRNRGTPSDRAKAAAVAGRLSKDEFDSLFERFDFQAEEEASIRFLSGLFDDEETTGPRM